MSEYTVLYKTRNVFRLT